MPVDRLADVADWIRDLRDGGAGYGQAALDLGSVGREEATHGRLRRSR